MNLLSNDFDIFGIAAAFALDRGALDQRWKDLQREAHPDRDSLPQMRRTQRQAMQWSVRTQRGLPAAERSAQARCLPV